MGPDKIARNTDGGPPATDGGPTDELGNSMIIPVMIGRLGGGAGVGDHLSRSSSALQDAGQWPAET
jgi:hypothetical protein